MNIEEFSDDEWQDILDELRLLVVRAGHADWDATTIEAMGDESDDRDAERLGRMPILPPVEQLRRYAAAFMRYLKARSRYAGDERRGQLADLLRTETGAPVADFLVDFGDTERPIFRGDDDPDAMIDVLRDLLAELNGEDGAFWNRPDDESDE